MTAPWKTTLLAIVATILCGCSTMKDSTRFNDLPTHYWNSLASDPVPDADAAGAPSVQAAGNAAMSGDRTGD